MSRAKVLVVDDSWTELTIISSTLQREGFDVITAVDGEEALEKTRNSVDVACDAWMARRGTQAHSVSVAGRLACTRDGYLDIAPKGAECRCRRRIVFIAAARASRSS